jgi:hypothetical protein
MLNAFFMVINKSWITKKRNFMSRQILGRGTNVMYTVVQIWQGQTVTCLHTNRLGHIWTTLYFQCVTEPRTKKAHRTVKLELHAFSPSTEVNYTAGHFNSGRRWCRMKAGMMESGSRFVASGKYSLWLVVVLIQLPQPEINGVIHFACSCLSAGDLSLERKTSSPFWRINSTYLRRRVPWGVIAQTRLTC